MENVTYRPATVDDTEGIYSLNQFWCKAYSDRQLENGFLKNGFSHLELEKLIWRNEAIVAEYDCQIIGYYLVNSTLDNDLIIERKCCIERLIKDKKLSSANYVYFTQVAVESKYKGNSVSKKMLSALKILVKDRYDFLVGVIYYENLHAKEIHINSGWKILSKIGVGYLAITSTNDIND